MNIYTQFIRVSLFALFLLMLTSSGFAQYCTASSNNDNFEWIANVTLNTINNNSTNTGPGYQDFTGLSTDLTQGSTYTISLSPDWSGVNYGEGFGVWIDFNQNDDFTDPGEQVVALVSNAVNPRTASFTVPINAIPGPTGMRVIMDDGITPTNPCSTPNFGEVEDYSINILAGSATCISIVNTFPYSEDFETNEGLWEQATDDDLNLIRDEAGTASAGTGPSSGDGDNFYMYLEASGNGIGFPSRTANYDSPCFDLTVESSAEFQYSYHMFGVDVGTLLVQLSTNNGFSYPVTLRTFSGNIGDFWNQDTIDLSAYSGQTIKIRFSITSGATLNGWSSDIAIDNVSFTTTTEPEINITGNGITITDGDITPDITDDTDFGGTATTVGTITNTFTIENSGTSNLNLTGLTPYVTIGGANAAEFTVSAVPTTPIAASGSTTFEITFSPIANGLRTATVSIANDDTDENPYNFNIQGTGISPTAEMDVLGNTIVITNNDITPSLADNTDFGNVDIAAGTNTNTFIIENNGGANTLNLIGVSPYVVIAGANAADFTVTTIPSNNIAAGNNTTFAITFNPSAIGLRTATVSIANNDLDENPYSFNIQGTGFVPPPCGIDIIHTADFESGLDGWTSGGTDASRVNDPTWSYGGNFSLRIRDDDPTGSATSFDSPAFDLSTYDKVDFKFFFAPNSMDSTYDTNTPAARTYTEEFILEYSSDNGANWVNVKTFESGQIASQDADFETSTSAIFYGRIVTLKSTDYSFPSSTTSRFRIRCDASDNNDRVFIDNITIKGVNYCTPSEAPGGINNNLDLWLKADMINGINENADGSAVAQWVDNAKGNNAEAMEVGLEPSFRNNTTQNFNFNPVVDFSNDFNTSGVDLTYINNLGSRNVLTGSAGFNSGDIFVVIMPDPTITNTMLPLDTFTSNDPGVDGEETNQDVTGFGYGSFSQRFTNEYFGYCIGTSAAGPPPQGYGRADATGSVNYNQIGIINIRHNAAVSGMDMYLNANTIGNITNDAADFSTINDTRFWLGRSQYFEGSFDGRIAEVITYSAANADGDLTQARNRIQSYLAIKYGITLGVNGTSQDYVDSDGRIIWDQSASVGYNYDIAGIGRDDDSELNQKQSSSVNNAVDGLGPIEGVLTVGLTDIYNTNSENKNLNTDTLNEKDYLVWGNNGADLELDPPTTITVNMSAGISPALTTEVTFTRISRVWKFVETGADVSTVKVRIPISAIRNVVPPGDYYMFISDTELFDPTATYTIMRPDGAGNLETAYDFDGTKYVTFGYAPEFNFVRSIDFDGTQDYMDAGNVVDLASEFTISAWVKHGTAANRDVISKRDSGPYTEGYALRFDASRTPRMVWKDAGGITRAFNASVSLPIDEWHHIAVIYRAGTAIFYIDGVEDTSLTAPAPAAAPNEHFLIGAANYRNPTNLFDGTIDEVRVWNTALTADQLRYIINQEIEESAGNFVTGSVLPQITTKNEVAPIPWSQLEMYLPMTTYTYTNVKDQSDNDHVAAIKNLNTVDRQTAPLPYVSTQNGDWDTNTTWTNGDQQYIPGSPSLVDSSITVDWNIVRTSHNVAIDNSSLPSANADNRKVLGLYVDANELTLNGDNLAQTGNGLTVSHYLSLTGKIDLEGESQLIQEEDSDLIVAINGELEKDQQGTADTYTYNYWSAPVGENDEETNEYSYTVQDIILDNTNPVNFTSAGYDGSNSSPITIADYWIWKFTNLTGGDYSLWQHVRRNGRLFAGEGFTMKGPGSGAISDDQNYVFLGKPNNGDINLTINAGNNYLIGNPYASAIDANEFIADNTDTSGTLYFWEHWGGGSHVLQEYRGGYAIYNLSGGVAATAPDPDVAQVGSGTKTPGRYVPVSQGFFVLGTNNGTITFENDQRTFQKEGTGSSLFVRNANSSNRTSNNESLDDRMKFRIGFDADNDLKLHRQLLLTIDENTTPGVDWAYDGLLNEDQTDDMYWMINDEKYIIQANSEASINTVYPLGLTVSNDGINNISIDELENVPSDIEIYVHDKDLNLYHDLRASDYEIFLNSGEYNERFEIAFSVNSAAALSTDDDEFRGLNILYANNLEKIVLVNPNQIDIKSIELFNMLGQSVYTIENISESDYSEYDVKNLSAGTYIIKLRTVSGSLSTKKVLVN
ncbi:choice-of-anchor D domain-containing protein [uncultured Winogradskyella sp.]|uniref:choice-of-anchor D domain-containing protein n=1 Tax=uncultured Winogradskyella sp. TaxID=395353 RepID=UPI0026395A31|nr:choice-of-anchor D domain-containing protein [uncultured Winogradskyella sp.]